MRDGIEAVAFDCYGTLVEFGDESFMRAYGVICAEQGLPIDGKMFYDKWMEVWRRLAREGLSSDGGSVGVAARAIALAPAENSPGPLSEAEVLPPHPAHHTPSAGRNRAFDGPLPEFHPYRDEWPEHFAICFEELGVKGDTYTAHTRLRELLCEAPAFPESQRVVEAVRAKLPVALLSNADDDFLHPVLAYNGLSFPVTISSELARAYKPHAAIFRMLTESLGLAPEKVLYVGDSRLADVAGAKNAGLRAAWINRRGADRSIEDGSGHADGVTPDYEIDSLERLIDILDLG
jgi:2-haloalkanoic acid dehalogenase type II